jgi:hypothetical protein
MCLSVEMMRFLSSELPPLACRNKQQTAEGSSVDGWSRHLKQLTMVNH